jgi:hypothetical protein
VWTRHSRTPPVAAPLTGAGGGRGGIAQVFDCDLASALPTATHALFAALAACGHTSAFGWAMGADADSGGSRQFDQYLLRLLHLAGKLSLCTL